MARVETSIGYTVYGLSSSASVEEIRYIGITKQPNTRARLTNLTSGGDGVKDYVITEETRQKMRDERKRNPRRYWLGKKRGKIAGTGAKKGYAVTAETRRKISERHKGRKHTDEFRKRISEIQKGKVRLERRILFEVKDILLNETNIYRGYDELCNSIAA